MPNDSGLPRQILEIFSNNPLKIYYVCYLLRVRVRWVKSYNSHYLFLKLRFFYFIVYRLAQIRVEFGRLG